MNITNVLSSWQWYTRMYSSFALSVLKSVSIVVAVWSPRLRHLAPFQGNTEIDWQPLLTWRYIQYITSYCITISMYNRLFLYVVCVCNVFESCVGFRIALIHIIVYVVEKGCFDSGVYWNCQAHLDSLFVCVLLKLIYTNLSVCLSILPPLGIYRSLFHVESRIDLASRKTRLFVKLQVEVKLINSVN